MNYFLFSELAVILINCVEPGTFGEHNIFTFVARTDEQPIAKILI